jgi:hypothetical protein
MYEYGGVSANYSGPDVLVPSELVQMGDTAEFSDNPGVFLQTPLGNLLWASLFKQYTTTMMVSSGNQMVVCPIVTWDAEVNITVLGLTAIGGNVIGGGQSWVVGAQ